MKNLNTNDLEKVNGGVAIGPFSPMPGHPWDDPEIIKEENDKPKDGGATGSW